MGFDIWNLSREVKIIPDSFYTRSNYVTIYIVWTKTNIKEQKDLIKIKWFLLSSVYACSAKATLKFNSG